MEKPTKEQQEELRKKIAAMSPEELKKFQKENCIFCNIVAGKVKAKRVYEDESCMAVLDINPASIGHVLLMPKEHYLIMPQVPDEELGHIFVIAKRLSNALLKSLDSRGTNIVVTNGLSAGQRAQHFLVHIIPRREGDGIKFDIPSKEYSEDELDNAARAISQKLGQKPGKKEQKIIEVREEDIAKAPENEKGEKPSRKAKKTDKGLDLDAISRVLNG
ncbi:HIT family protein [Candidatus Woesearchaeota archaeon]|nr:HIT family protein [Candidatus Woesearchaeota archaeon]